MNPSTSVAPPTVLPSTVTEFETRFLFPFYFERGQATAAAETLIHDTLPAPGKTGGALWKRADPPHFYTDEFLDHVVRYLFPKLDRKPDEPHPECEYLVLDPQVLSQWFKDAELVIAADGQRPEEQCIPLRPAARVELFLTSQAVGLLSVTLGADHAIVRTSTSTQSAKLDPGDVRDFNYLLSQFRQKRVANLRKLHPTRDSEKAAKVDPAKVKPAPAADSPLADRLYTAGGEFSLKELVTRLVREPLVDLGVVPVEPRELALYTVVRFPVMDFADQTVRLAFGPLLSGLAQVEERNHPGACPDEPNVPHAVLNRRHWAAVGVLAAAHLVADEIDAAGQPAPFNEQRVPTVRDKYFISFLVTMLQRMTLNRAVDEAADIFTTAPALRSKRTAQLRQDLLRFGVGGQYNQINSRHAHHRYYQLCRQGLDVIPAWEDIRGLLAELDADRIAREEKAQQDVLTKSVLVQEGQQRDLNNVAQDLDTSVRKIERIQGFIHIIEFLLGLVYGAHLFHMLFAENSVVIGWLAPVWERLGCNPKQAHDCAATTLTAIGAVLGVILVFIVDRWQKERGQRSEEKRQQAKQNRDGMGAS